MYVAQYYPPETKAAADQLVKNVIGAMDRRIDKLDWMVPETKVKAHEKLAAFTPKIGYPDRWRDYANLSIDRSSYLGNLWKSEAFDVQRDLQKIGKPQDPNEWYMSPPTVNAYYDHQSNEIAFHAGILQPPFFSLNADSADK